MHTAASLAIASGADIKRGAADGPQVGRDDLDQYRHLFPDRLDVVADAMDAARSSALADVSPEQPSAEVRALR